MEERARNILIGLVVLFLVLAVGAAYIGPQLQQEARQGGPGETERGRALKLLEEGRLAEADQLLAQVIQRHPGTPAAVRAEADRQHGIAYHRAVGMARAGAVGEARTLLLRVAREGAQTDWGAKAQGELSRLGQAAGPAAGAGPGAPPDQAARQARLAQANSLMEAGRAEEARPIFEGLAAEGANDPVATAARLSLQTLQAAGHVVGRGPEVGRARLALLRARASLLGYRGETGRLPESLEAQELERFGFSYRDLLAEVQRVESYRVESEARFEIIAVARDARGTRLRATDQAVEDLP